MSINTANVTTTGGNIYTSSGNTVVTWLSLCNTTAGNITANVHVLASGATANSMNTIISNVLITIGDTYQIYTGNEKLLLDNAGAIYAIASANSLSAVTSYTSA
jgi:hypothetical protein